MYSEKDYDDFSRKMETSFPKMFEGRYGGFCIGPGWWPILEALCSQIHSYTEWRNNTREALLKSNPHNQKIPEAVPQVVVQQIKEKFGGLRFYYNGGDDHIQGMVRMAEIWAGSVCEECGHLGKSRNTGWIKTLCDKHYAEREERYARDNGLEL
jgi:hypothetical protein